MEKYQGIAVSVALALLVGAAVSETVFKVQWSMGLMTLIGVPLAAVFAKNTAEAIKTSSERKTMTKLNEASALEPVPSETGEVEKGESQ